MPEKQDSDQNESDEFISENGEDMAEAIELTPESELETQTKKAAELEDRLLRTQAEFDNYRKRMEGRFMEASKFASEGIILKVLDILDNVERAVEIDFSLDPKSAQEGINAIKRQIQSLLAKEDVRPIESLGKQFDPYYQHAVGTVSNNDKPDGAIVEVYQKGYMLKEKVLRPAMVCVNRHELPADESEAEDGSSSKNNGD
ncbi:MAG: nucleotide exchange factor GrpE [Promethearchaeota archaeon]